MSILLLFRQGGGWQFHPALIGGHFYPAKRRRFDDLERRKKLRETIEAAMGEPAVREAMAPYVRQTLFHVEHPKLNWAKIYENMAQIEQNLAALQEIIEKDRSIDDDDEDMMELI